MRVLHVIDPSLQGGRPCSLRTLADLVRYMNEVRHETLVLGTRNDVEAARASGVRVTGHLCPPPGASRACNTLGEILASFRAAGISFDVIHAWTKRAADLAWRAAPNIPQINFNEPIFAIDPVVAQAAERTAIRKAWAQPSPPSETTFVVGVLSEPPRACDARVAMTVGARLALARRDLRMVMHPEIGRRAEAVRFCADLGLHDLLVFDDRLDRPWLVAAGLDAALLIGPTVEATGKDVSAGPLLWACAAGVAPIVDDRPALAAHVREGVDGFVVRQHNANLAADRVARLHDDRDMARRLGAAARQHVLARHHIDDLCHELRSQYQAMRERAAGGEGSGCWPKSR